MMDNYECPLKDPQTFTDYSNIIPLGVRLGFYLQFAAVICASLLKKGDVLNGIVTGALSTLALLLALTHNIKSASEDTYIPDFIFLPALQLAALQAYLGYEYVKSAFLLLPLLALQVWTAVLGLWFWIDSFRALPSGKKLYIPDCGTTYAFFFTKTEAYGWYRIVAISIIGVSALNLLLAGVLYLIKFLRTRRLRQPAKPMSKLKRTFHTVIQLFLLAFTVLFVEFTLVWNNVVKTSINTTGQIIALLFGIFVFLHPIVQRIVIIKRVAALFGAEVDGSDLDDPDDDSDGRDDKLSIGAGLNGPAKQGPASRKSARRGNKSTKAQATGNKPLKEWTPDAMDALNNV